MISSTPLESLQCRVGHVALPFEKDQVFKRIEPLHRIFGFGALLKLKGGVGAHEEEWLSQAVRIVHGHSGEAGKNVLMISSSDLVDLTLRRTRFESRSSRDCSSSLPDSWEPKLRSRCHLHIRPHRRA